MRRFTWFLHAAQLGMIGLLVLPAGLLRADDDDAAADANRAPNREESSNEREEGDEQRGQVSEYWLGLELEPPPAELREKLKLDEGQGLLVEQVMPGSPAAKAGIESEDVLLKANGKPVQKLSDLVELLKSGKDQPIKITLLHDGEEATVKVTPAKRPGGGLQLGGNVTEQQRSALRKMAKELERMHRKGQQGGRMHRIGSGMNRWPAHNPAQFPDDLSVTIKKEGNTPARIDVKRGDKSWSVAENEIGKLPEDVRPHVQGMLGRGAQPQFQIRIAEGGEGEQGGITYTPLPGQPGSPWMPGQGDGPHPRIMRELKRLNYRLHELEEQVHAMAGGQEGRGYGEQGEFTRGPREREDRPELRPRGSRQNPRPNPEGGQGWQRRPEDNGPGDGGPHGPGRRERRPPPPRLERADPPGPSDPDE